MELFWENHAGAAYTVYRFQMIRAPYSKSGLAVTAAIAELIKRY